MCEAARAACFGGLFLPCLKRVTAVAKSALASAGGRSTLQQHYDSMRANRPVERPDKITIVDDIVTKGATLLAGASLLREAFPDDEVRLFALVRTRGLVPEIERIVDPVVGSIRNRFGVADREP
jgi:predicted amidophosphoribosyltransferase